MTSASELFYERRSRWGRTNPDLGSDSVLPDRNFHSRPRSHHSYCSHQRHQSNGCDPLRRSSQNLLHICNRDSYTLAQEGRPALLDQQRMCQLDSSNSFYSDALAGTFRTGISGNDRLPEAVQHARARVLKRLRGVPLSGKSESTVDSSSFNLTYRRESLQILPEPTKKSPGLSPEALDCLHLEVFTSKSIDIKSVVSRASWDCIICLESFMEGDKLIRLPCDHRFHSSCLYPWLRTCRDCPHCRNRIETST